ncbi:hypothetical protein GCM10009535_56760 [Streptomyces thermocarboxydovorans]|uniref:Aminoglycoside phosphotransferase domain-containing protein n=1 Tax=Streptomyces thermocarboxydovorans TaxID=59298 RepID=A0ABN1HVN1_9ACTN
MCRKPQGTLWAELLHGGRSSLTYLVTDGRFRWVVRRPPLGGLTPSAHDMGREYRIVAALHDTGVPVARAVSLCENPEVLGVPFSVVSHVPGREDLHVLPQAGIDRCATALIDVLAGLHAVPYEEIGLSGFGRPEGYLARQVRRWRDQWQRVATRELPDIDTLYKRLAADVPVENGASIVHGDYRIDNAILAPGDPGTVCALVDWEMATVGDPLADLGMTLEGESAKIPAGDAGVPPGEVPRGGQPVAGGGGGAAQHRVERRIPVDQTSASATSRSP